MSGSQGTLPTGNGYAGQSWQQSGGDVLNAVDFITRRVMGEKAFAGMVKVISCSNTGGLAPIGTVTVQPMVHQTNTLGTVMPHGSIFNLPYCRIQGGSSAVVLDPVAGDIGVAVFCDRDTSAVRATGAPAAPGSMRRNDWADGIYLFTVSAGAPTTYIMLNGINVNIVTPGNLTISAANATLTAAGNLRVAGTVTSGANNNTLSTHTHSGGAPPTAGT